jgi:hypothetical protein
MTKRSPTGFQLVVDHTLSRRCSLAPSARLVLLAVTRRMRQIEGRWRSFPGYRTIAADTGLCRRSVQAHVAALCGGEQPLLHRQTRFKSNTPRQRDTYLYSLNEHHLRPSVQAPVPTPPLGAPDLRGMTGAHLLKLRCENGNVTGPLRDAIASCLTEKNTPQEALRLAAADEPKVRAHIIEMEKQRNAPIEGDYAVYAFAKACKAARIVVPHRMRVTPPGDARQAA